MIVCDIEGNGLLPEVTEIWCICMENTENDAMYDFPPSILDEAFLVLNKDATVIGHNFIGYDLPALRKVMGFNYEGKVIDTMLMSQFLFPERVGGHSLDAWGERLGISKIEHDEWDRYSPAMLERCRRDVLLTRLVYEVLCEEAGEQIEGIYINEYSFDNTRRT